VLSGGDSCSVANGHPENGGYYMMGFSYKDKMAHEDKDDTSTYGDHGQKADDYRWEKGITYPDALPKECKVSMYNPCTSITSTHSLMTAHTCAILRFSFKADSGSTVYQMTSNETFQACDFTDATKIEPLADLKGSNGETLVDFPFEQDAIDKTFYFASQDACADGQKVAVMIIEEYSNTYDACYSMGTETARIQHCDCDHSLKPGSLAEVCGTGFIDGCKKELPDDLSCCPGEDGKIEGSGMSAKYVNGGNCIPKSKQEKYEADAKLTYEFCTNPDNKAACDSYLDGDCPWWRVYSYGSWTYNTEEDGCDKPCPNMLRYGARGKKMEDKPSNYGCDCKNSTYTATCDVWYTTTHCKKLENGDKEHKFPEGIDANACGMSQHYAAFKAHFNQLPEVTPDMWDNWDGEVDTLGSTALAAFSLIFALFA